MVSLGLDLEGITSTDEVATGTEKTPPTEKGWGTKELSAKQ